MRKRVPLCARTRTLTHSPQKKRLKLKWIRAILRFLRLVWFCFRLIKIQYCPFIRAYAKEEEEENKYKSCLHSSNEARTAHTISFIPTHINNIILMKQNRAHIQWCPNILNRNRKRKQKSSIEKLARSDRAVCYFVGLASIIWIRWLCFRVCVCAFDIG